MFDRRAVDRDLATIAARGLIVGLVIVVYRNGVPVCEEAVGYADREAGVEMRLGTAFRLSGMTKPIVSAATLAAAEAGLLDIGDVVTRFLPWFRPRTADGEEARITLRHLLTHTAGLDYGYQQETPGLYAAGGVSDGLDRPGIDAEENLRRLASMPLGSVPGTKWRYSLATDVLGAVLAAACGVSLPEVVARFVTGPLGMRQTAFIALEDTELAVPYADPTEHGREPTRKTDPFVHDTVRCMGTLRFSPGRAWDAGAHVSGGTGMIGTAHDAMRFIEAIRTGGAPILSRGSAAALTTEAVRDLDPEPDPYLDPQLGLDSDDGWAFGLGVMTADRSGHHALAHCFSEQVHAFREPSETHLALGVACLRDPLAAALPLGDGSWSWHGVHGTSFLGRPEGTGQRGGPDQHRTAWSRRHLHDRDDRGRRRGAAKNALSAVRIGRRDPAGGR